MELAAVLPVLVLMLLGSLELGRAIMVRHVLEEAARAGCRVGVMDGSTRDIVEDIVDAAMAAGGLTDYTLTVTPDPLVDLTPLQPVTVQITIPYNSISWVNAGFMGGKTIEGVCVMPAEGVRYYDFDDNAPLPGKKAKKNKKAKKAKKISAAKKAKK